MANVPRKHHYVPQTLLKGFTLNGANTGRLHIVDLTRCTTYPSTPEKSMAEADYNLIDLPGVDPFVVESDLLAKLIEDPATQGLGRIRAGAMPNDDDHARLLSFVAMQAVRAPGRRDAFDDFATQVRRAINDEITESDAMFDAAKKGHPELADFTREEARELGSTIEWKYSPTGHLGVQLPSFGPVLELLAARSWCVLSADDGAPDFVCCDDPVVLLPAGSRPIDAPRGFGSVDASVFMPVGRRHGLFGVWPLGGESPTWGRQAADARQVALMNTMVVLSARRFVASAEPDFVWALGNRLARRAEYLDAVRNRPREVK